MPALKVAVGSVLAALLQSGTALRKAHKKAGTETDMMMVSDVPVFNYGLRHQQHAGAGVFEWVLFLQQGSLVDGFCRHVRCNTRGHSGGVPFVSVGASEEELRGLLKAFPDEVSFAEPDLDVYVPEDAGAAGPAALAEGASASELWHLNRVGRARATSTGKGVHIYVMDTGVRSTHRDFGGRAIPTLDTIAGSGTPIECNGDAACGTDYHGHGTHVAGSAGGTNYGVAPEASLHIMKVCCGAGTNTLGGMDWIIENAEYPAIMTVSLASQGRSESSRRAVDRVVAAGVTVTVGAANDNVDTCTMTYGFIPSAISVGATDSNDKRARFSNFGPCNDIYAPGVAIFSAWNLGDDDVKTISGTSMATPIVAGAAALLLQKNPTHSSEKVLAELQRMSVRGVITDLQDGDPDMLLAVA